MREKISIVLVAAIILASSIGTQAATKTISIPRYGYGESRVASTRTGKYSYVQTRCLAVYPQGEYTTDNFTKIRVRIRNSSDTVISGEKVLTEGNALTNVSLYEGYLDSKNIYFSYYGNSSSYPATAQVEYIGK